MIHDYQIDGAVNGVRNFLAETPARNSIELNEALDQWLTATEVALVDIKMAHYRFLIECNAEGTRIACEELEYLLSRRQELTEGES